MSKSELEVPEADTGGAASAEPLASTNDASEPIAVSSRGRQQDDGKVVSLNSMLSRVTSGVRFLGLTFDVLKINDAARLVVERGRRNLPFAYVVTPNVDHRVRLAREPGLLPLYASAWMTLCDSRIIELMARMDRVGVRASPGADLVEHLFEREIDASDPLNVIGSTEDVIGTLKARFGLKNLRWHQCPQELRDSPEAVVEAARFVAENPAPVTFICVGSPQQELVARAIIERGDAQGVGLCCGASLEFLSGKVPRAPRWMRNLALEWLHRLATNPVRFGRRYLIDGPKIFPIWLRSRQEKIPEEGGQSAAAPVRGSVIPVHPAA